MPLYSIPGLIISIHPPREGWDHTTVGPLSAIFISIHPPREGWDQKPLGHGVLGK